MTHDVLRLTYNDHDDSISDINSNGHVLWVGGAGANDDIFLYNGSNTTEISDDIIYTNRHAQINESGYVVWQRSGASYGFQIVLYDGLSTSQISDSSYTNSAPQINDDGYAAWCGYETSIGSNSDIFIYDGLTTIRLENDTYDDFGPQINGNGNVVWQGCQIPNLPIPHYEIFLYDGSNITQLTNNSHDDRYPDINDQGLVVWQGSDGSDYEIFLYDGLGITQLTNNSHDDRHPRINNQGYVVWNGSDGSDTEIFLYDGSRIRQVTDNAYDDYFPQISDIHGSGYVAWQGYDGSDFEIFVYDDWNITQVTDNSYYDSAPLINDQGLVVWSGTVDSDSEIFLATPGHSETVGKWVAKYDGPPHEYNADRVEDLAVDSSGNVYVTGKSVGLDGIKDFATVKYDSSGNELWVARQDGRAFALALDADGNVYVTGDGMYDYNYRTIKYDTDGNELWLATYDEGGGFDRALDIAVDDAGNSYVIGESAGDFALIKYDTYGNQLWVARYDGPDSRSDSGEHIALDDLGNVYVTGTSADSDGQGHYCTIKYNNDGDQLWVARCDNLLVNRESNPNGLAVDGDGNVYITGYFADPENLAGAWDFGTIKYDTNGNELWLRLYAPAPESNDRAYGLTLDNAGNVYVIGESQGDDLQFDFTTVKYNPDGYQLWVRRYNNGNGGAGATDVAVDHMGSTYVTGFCRDIKKRKYFVTIKYDWNGNEIWTANGYGTFDCAELWPRLALDSTGNIYIAGSPEGNTQHQDYFTLKLSQSSDPGMEARFFASPKSGVPPLVVSFTDFTLGTVDSWEWDFDNDMVVDSTEQNPTYEYLLPGYYCVNLVVRGTDESSFITNRSIYVVGPIIEKLKPRPRYPKDRIRIIGSGFGATQGTSVVHINNKVFGPGHKKIKFWSDRKIKIRIPNYKCTWFKGKDFRRPKVWVTVDGVDTNIMRFKVLKPLTCP
jgi:hypothetical protein